jgi:hypothetical protein
MQREVCHLELVEPTSSFGTCLHKHWSDNAAAKSPRSSDNGSCKNVIKKTTADIGYQRLCLPIERLSVSFLCTIHILII